MYELRLNARTKPKFLNVMKDRLYLKNMTLKDLAREIDRPITSIYYFTSHDEKQNRFLAAEIAEYLEIKREDYI